MLVSNHTNFFGERRRTGAPGRRLEMIRHLQRRRSAPACSPSSFDGGSLNVDNVVVDNLAQSGTADVQRDTTPSAIKESRSERRRRKKAAGTVHRHYIFVPHATLEKCAPVFGKLCGWWPARNIALKLLQLTCKFGHACIIFFHSVDPYVRWGKTGDPSTGGISSENAIGEAHPPRTTTNL